MVCTLAHPMTRQASAIAAIAFLIKSWLHRGNRRNGVGIELTLQGLPRAAEEGQVLSRRPDQATPANANPRYGWWPCATLNPLAESGNHRADTADEDVGNPLIVEYEFVHVHFGLSFM